MTDDDLSPDGNGYEFECGRCGSLNIEQPIQAFRPGYEWVECWRCGTVNVVETDTGAVNRVELGPPGTSHVFGLTRTMPGYHS